MKIRGKRKTKEEWRADLLVVAVEKQELKKGADKKRKARSAAVGVGPGIEDVVGFLGQGAQKRFSREEFEAKSLQTFFSHLPDGAPAQGLLLVGLPEEADNDGDRISNYRRLGASIQSYAKKYGLKDVCLSNKNLDLRDADNLNAVVEGVALSSYGFGRYKSEKKSESNKGVAELTILGENISERFAADMLACCEGTALARDLVNTPPRDCTPSHLVDEARKIAKEGKLKLQVYDFKALKKIGAGGILAVAQGSDEPPFIIKLTYSPSKRSSKKVALVGKGVTFDSGGLSLKPANSMETMKCDMSGAAAVLGAMKAIAKIKPRVEVCAYIPTTENMVNGAATRPGDVIRTMKGKTVEVLNTDAEGRLILADALAMAERDKCDMIVDIATLTGACMVALGNDVAGLFSNDERLAAKIIRAAELSGEKVWRMPLVKEYRDLIKSSVADIKNTGGRHGGAITAALFLKEFVSKAPWAHIDMAGPAFNEGGGKGHTPQGGTGFGVRTLVRFVEGI